MQVIRGRLSAVEAATISSKVRGKLGTGGGQGGSSYFGSSESGLGKTKTYGFIREIFRRDVAVQLGDERRGALRDITDGSFKDMKPAWDPETPGRFLHADARLSELHDAGRFELLAAAEVYARAERVEAVRAPGRAVVAAGRAAAVAAETKACSACGKPDATQRCSGCRIVSYCARECQTAHWKEGGHRAVCKLLAAERQGPGAGTA